MREAHGLLPLPPPPGLCARRPASRRPLLPIPARNGTAIGATQPLSIGATLAALGSGASQYMVTGRPFDHFASDGPAGFPTGWAHFDRSFMNILDP
jgi:hypothetical protein